MITRPDARRSNGVGLSATSGSRTFSAGDIIGLRTMPEVWQLYVRHVWTECKCALLAESRDPPCLKLGTTTVLCVPLRVRKKDLSDVSKHASTGPSNTLGNIYALRSSTCCFYSTEHAAWSAVVSSKIAPSSISSAFDYIVAFLMLVSSHLGIDRLLDSMTSCVLLSPAKVPRQVPFLPDLSRETVLSIRNSLLGDFFIRDSLDAESTTVARESIDRGANNGGRVVDGYLHPVLDGGSYNDP